MARDNRGMNRDLWVRLHRWLGLGLAIFLFSCGLTGSLLAFREPLQHWLSPPPAVAPRQAPVLDAIALRERLLAQRPDVTVSYVRLDTPAPDRAHLTWVSPATAGTRLDHRALWQDPTTGAVIGPAQPHTGLWPLTRDNAMDTVYALHYHLALPGVWGERAKTLLGLAALGWVITAVIGIVLTWPAAKRQPTGKAGSNTALKTAWWRRWAPAWQLKRGASAYRRITDLHRAGSLWLWGLLLVIAWTAVGFNLPGQLYERVMGRIFGYAPEALAEGSAAGPVMPWPDALARARAAMAAAAQREGFTVQHESAFRHEPNNHRFVYDVASSRDLNPHHGRTTLAIDDHDGRPLGLYLPTGQHAGVTVDHWLKSFHMARIGGTAGQVLVSAIGLFVAFLSVSGVYLWWKKRQGRVAARRLQRQRA